MQLCKTLLLGLSFLLTANIVYAEGRSAEQIYTTSCATCHATGVANAPKIHDTSAWKARAKNLDELLASAKKGLNAMPPMGLCADCTDAELKATISHMMSQKKE